MTQNESTDRPERLKEKWLAQLTKEKGEDWVKENEELLDLQFDYLKDCNFI